MKLFPESSTTALPGAEEVNCPSSVMLLPLPVMNVTGMAKLWAVLMSIAPVLLPPMVSDPAVMSLKSASVMESVPEPLPTPIVVPEV